MLVYAGSATVLAGCATQSATPATQTALPANYFDTTPGPFPQFSTVAEYPQYGFNFGSWDELIRKVVIDFGKSDRVLLSQPKPAIGSRFVKGHRSPYRTEGNRIPFSVMRKKEDKQQFVQARQVLEELGNKQALSEFSWRDQMAFWYNLHNAALIEQLALNYPVPHPGRLRVGGVGLHDAKLVTIHGAPLSLRDIRVEIVYRYTRHPAAIYGFFHGDVGGPSIRKGAYVGGNLDVQLAQTADEFINSQRGVREYGSYVGVSMLYNEAKPLFPSWPQDLRAHLNKHAEGDVKTILGKGLAIRTEQYDTRIADLAGGDTRVSSISRGSSLAQSANNPQTQGARGMPGSILDQLDRYSSATQLPGLPPHASRLLRERQNKLANLSGGTGLFREGTVTIEDLPTKPVG